MPDPSLLPDLSQEQAYTAHVQQLLWAVIEESQRFSNDRMSDIYELLADAWDELRLKPTNVSTQEMESLRLEVNRYLARKSLTDNQARRSRQMLLNPFFARVDFREDDQSEVEKIVIGLYSLKDSNGDILVHDWRAPVSGLYYDSLPGACSYRCPEGVISGEMTLKRQYRMENGRLIYYVDTTFSIDDGLLLDILSQNVSGHMHGIVNTIQQEQNRAIRFEDAKVVSIVGSAGSGKTSVAMHRAAYLLYRRRDTLRADRVLILSPSPVFSEYISTVLPELGEENTRSETLHRIVQTILGRKVEHPLDQVGQLLGDMPPLRRRSVEWKYSEAFFERALEAIGDFAAHGPHFEDIRLKNNVLIPAADLTAMYESELRALSPAQRLERMALRLDSMVESLERTLYRQYEEQYSASYSGKKLTFMVNMAVAQHLQPLRADVRRITQASPETILLSALKDAPEELRQELKDNRDAHLVWWEDAVFLALFSVSLGFSAPDKRMRHLLIDEAQDYPEAALALLRCYYPRAEVTILGDPKQRTCPGMPACDPARWGAAMGLPDAPVLRLNRSYRSTLEINRLLNRLTGDTTSDSFGRHGAEPEFIPADAASIQEAVQRLRDDGMNTVAILTRTPQQAQRLSRQLKDIYLLDDDENPAYEVGDTVLCCYHMAKGMEFDGVVVLWPDVELTDGERRRLYTALSRALHRLVLAVEPALREQLAAMVGE